MAEKLELVFGELARRDEAALLREVRKLGLAGPSGPNRVSAPQTQAAWDLARWLGYQSIGALRDALADGGERTVGDGWRVLPPAPDVQRLPGATIWGIPFLALSSEDALEVAVRMLAARRLPQFAPVHRNIDVRLAEFLAYEHWLWELAGHYGGAAPRIPYAFRVRALTWFWNPDVHREGLRAPTICVRCGSFMVPRHPIRSEPRCSWCAKEPPDARIWPKHAVAPAERGTWWLDCRGCSEAFFIGRRNRHRCDNCDSSRLTASRRLRSA